MQTDPHTPSLTRRQIAWRAAATVGILAVLAAGFWAYTQPGMKLNWETLARLCGF